MPRKKKIVNEEINLAPNEQDLSVNEVKPIEEIKESKVAPKAKRSTSKSPKIRTKTSIEAKEISKIDIVVEQGKSNQVVQSSINVSDIIEVNKEFESDLKKEKASEVSESPKAELINSVADASIEIINSEKNDQKKFNRFKNKQKQKRDLQNKTLVNINTENENQQKAVESINDDKPKNILSINEAINLKIDNPINIVDEVSSEIPTISKEIENTETKTAVKRYSKWDKRKKFNRDKVANKIENEQKINAQQVNIENIEVSNQAEVSESVKIKSPINAILETESTKIEEVKDEPIEIKQEERKPNKKKKKNKNKKDKVDSTTSNENIEAKDSDKPQQAEKKLEPAKVIRKPEPEIVITINPKKMLTKEQEKNPFMMKFFTQLEDFLRKEVQIEKGQKLLVAMSGGVDSSVLFDALSVLSFKMKFVIYVLHFNHKLRGLSSERDEKLVNQLSKDYNVQYFNASGNVKEFAERNSLSIEYAARQLRYNFFEKVARTLNANFVATAHTADDNVETFFLNLFRGSGLTGLSGIPAKRNLVKNVMMLRPLITFRKKELLEYAKIRRLKWFEDETNSLLNYTRNKIRLSLIPRLEEEFNPSITDIINQTAKLMSGADRLIRDIVKKNYPLVVEDASQEKFIVKMPMLMANEEFIQGEIIQYLWLKYFRLQPLPMQTINRILALNLSQTGAICEINSMYFVLKDRNNLIFTKRQYEENIKLLVSIPGKYFIGRYKIEFTEVDRSEVVFDENPSIEFFDRSIMDSFLEIRNWQMGDTFQPLGLKGEMKVSDFLVNEKVPITEKASVIILTNKSEIIWIVGKRISDKFKIKKNAEKVIKAVIVKNEKK